LAFGGRWQHLIPQVGWYSLLGYAALLPFRFFAPLRLTTPRGVLLTIVVLALICQGVQGRWIRSPLDKPLLALALAALLSSFSSIDLGYSLHSLKREMLPFLVLFWGTWNWSGDPRRKKELTLTLLLSCLLVVSLSLIFGKYQGSRFKGIFPYPTQVGKYMDLMIPLLAGVTSSPLYPLWQRIGTLLLLLSSMVLVELSLTRTSLALMVPSLGVIFASVHKRSAWAVAALCLMVLIASGILYPKIRGRIYPLLTQPAKVFEKDPAMKERYQIYKNSVRVIKTRPLLGWGYGRHIARRITRERNNGNRHLFWHSHNLFLEVTLQCGVVGLAAMLWLLMVFLKEAWHSLKEAWVKGETETLGYLVGLGAIGAHSMVSIPQWGTTLLIAIFMARSISEGERCEE
jgi:O-antigen ligase